MAYTLIRAGRLMAMAFATYLAAGCAASIQDGKAPDTAPSRTEAQATDGPSEDRLADVQLSVARAAFDQGSLDAALQLFEKAHLNSPGAAAPLIGRGDTLYAQRRFDAAETAYRAALQRAPASFEANEGLGKTLVTLKKFHAGLRAFEAARAVRANAPLLNKIGVTHELLGDGAAAQAMFREALALDESSLTARNNLALSLAVSGSYDAALSEMDRVVADPKSSERHHANLAFIYGLAGRPLDRAPAKAVQAAASKGWDAQFFARTREIAKTGDRAAILDLLNSRAVQTAALPAANQLPDLPETPAMPEARAERSAPASAPAEGPAPVTLAPTAPTAPEAAGAPAPQASPDASPEASPEASNVPAPPAAATGETAPAAPVEASPEPAEPTVGDVAIVAEQAPAPAPAETAAPVVPPPSAPAETPAAPPAAAQDTLVMRAPSPGPAQSAAPPTAAATGAPAHHVQLGAWPTRWLGRALRQLAARAGDVLPAGRIEVVRSANLHTLRSASIAALEEARRLCTTLRSRTVDCFVTRQSSPPPGQAFDTARAGDSEALALFLASVEPIAPLAAPAKTGPEQTVSALPAEGAGPAQPAPAAAGARPEAGEFRLQFAAYRHPAHLVRGIEVLRHKAGELLPAIERLVRTETSQGTAIPYRLRSVPLESRAAAADLCKSLSEKGIECLVIRHGPAAWLPLF